MGNNLVFSIGGKMSALAGLGFAFHVSFKVLEADFVELTERQGIVHASYFPAE